MAQKAVELILMRQLASYLAVPIFLVDPDGNLLFYNEPAERLLGRRYDETGEMPADEWATAFAPTAEDGSPLRAEELPLSIALQQWHPAHRTLVIRGLDGVAAAHRRDRLPARWAGPASTGRRRHLLGGPAGVRLTLWGTRGSVAAAGPETVRYGGNTSCVEVRAADGSVLVLDAGTGMRRLGVALRGRSAPGGHPADPPPHGPHPGARLLRSLLRGRPPGAPVGPAVDDAGAPGAAHALPVAPALPRAAARAAVPPRSSRRAPRDIRDRAFRATAALICHPGPTVGYRIDRGRRDARLPAGSRAGARVRADSRRARLDLRVRPCGRRRRAGSRRAVQRGRVRRPRRLGA